MDLSVAKISEFGIGFVSLFGGLPKKIAPPEGAEKFWPLFAALIAAASFLCVKLFAHMSASLAQSFVWGVVALAFIVAGIVLSFAYVNYRNAWTLEYLGQSRIVGSQLKPLAEQHLKKFPNLTRAELLRDFGSDSKRVWTEDSLKSQGRALAARYCLAIACLAFGLYLGVEAANATAEGLSSKPVSFSESVAGLKDVHFDLNKSDLGQDAAERLTDDVTIVGTVFQKFPHAALILEGYCDDQGSFAHNLSLGYQRAKAVSDALVRAQIPADKLRVATYGKTAMLCSEATEDCRKKNRRVHLTLVESPAYP